MEYVGTVGMGAEGTEFKSSGRGGMFITNGKAGYFFMINGPHQFSEAWGIGGSSSEDMSDFVEGFVVMDSGTDAWGTDDTVEGDSHR